MAKFFPPLQNFQNHQSLPLIFDGWACQNQQNLQILLLPITVLVLSTLFRTILLLEQSWLRTMAGSSVDSMGSLFAASEHF